MKRHSRQPRRRDRHQPRRRDRHHSRRRNRRRHGHRHRRRRRGRRRNRNQSRNRRAVRVLRVLRRVATMRRVVTMHGRASHDFWARERWELSPAISPAPTRSTPRWAGWACWRHHRAPPSSFVRRERTRAPPSSFVRRRRRRPQEEECRGCCASTSWVRTCARAPRGRRRWRSSRRSWRCLAAPDGQRSRCSSADRIAQRPFPTSAS